jgi:hypothetical protein
MRSNQIIEQFASELDNEYGDDMIPYSHGEYSEPEQQKELLETEHLRQYINEDSITNQRRAQYDLYARISNHDDMIDRQNYESRAKLQVQRIATGNDDLFGMGNKKSHTNGNPWIYFLRMHAGKGYTRAQLRKMYKSKR